MRSTVLCAALLAAPSVAQACAVCFDPLEANRNAFIIATAFMTFFPLMLIGGVLYYLRRRWLAMEAASPEA
jgi:hypothetical protein